MAERLLLVVVQEDRRQLPGALRAAVPCVEVRVLEADLQRALRLARIADMRPLKALLREKGPPQKKQKLVNNISKRTSNAFTVTHA